MARWTHNRFHSDVGTNWRSCTMISCRLARRQLDDRASRRDTPEVRVARGDHLDLR
jgi:hypothetical protein